MSHTEIKAKQMEALLAFYYFGSSVVTGSSNFANQDSWICIIIGTILAVPLVLLYSAVIEMYPGRNYYDNIMKACGKIAGKIIVFFLSLYALFVGALVLRNEAEFIHIVNLTETPLVAILASIVGANIYVMKHRIYVLARVAKFVLPIIYLTVMLTIVLSIKDWDIDHMKPFLNNSFGTLMAGSLLVLSLPFGESVVCSSMFGQLDPHYKSFPVFLKGILLGFIIMIMANLRNLLVLGYSAGYYAFPSYAAVSVIAVGEFFTRIEVLIGINLLLAGFFKVCVLLFSSCSGFAKALGLKDYEPIAASCGLAMLTLSMFTSANTQEMFHFEKFIPYFSLPIQIVIPLAVLITGKIRNIRNRLKPKKKQVPSAAARRIQEEGG